MFIRGLRRLESFSGSTLVWQSVAALLRHSIIPPQLPQCLLLLLFKGDFRVISDTAYWYRSSYGPDSDDSETKSPVLCLWSKVAESPYSTHSGTCEIPREI